MDISIVIPSYNEEHNIAACLKAIKAQKFKGSFEVIVVDGKSTDHTVEIASKYADTVIQQKSKYISGARSDGYAIAKGRIFVSTDADCIPDDNWLDEIQKSFDNKNVVCVFGDLIPSRKTVAYRLMFFFGNIAIHIASTTGLHQNLCGANSAFLADSYRAIGGYKIIPISEDVDLGERLKKIGKVVYNKKMKTIFNTRRMDKYGKYKMVAKWLTFLIQYRAGRLPKEVKYAKETY